MKKLISYLGAVLVVTCSFIFVSPVRVMAAVEGQEPMLLSENANDVVTNYSTLSDRELRRDLVDYALQFVGNPYRRGGTDPNTGADCSGFVRYVMANGAGIHMDRTSREQAKQGTQISSEEMKPGDLLFYGNGSRINHVAMYIGDGKIVHASTEKTGIKTSKWNYRNPVRIVNMIG